MSTSPTAPVPPVQASRAAPVVPATRRRYSDDWAATILGLSLVALVLLGVLTDAVVP